ncbi:MAG: DUF7289 family protein [Halobacteriota archaeon]
MNGAAGDDRAITELVSYVLIFALVISTVATVSIVGFDSLSNRQEAEQITNVERSFDVLSDNLRDVERHGDRSRATEIRISEGELLVGDPIRITVGEYDSSADAFTANNQTFLTRPIVYRTGDRTVTYEAGAVFRSDGEHGLQTREPNVTNGTDAVTLSFLSLYLGGGSRAVSGPTTALVVAEASPRPAPIYRFESEAHDVGIEIQSPRADEWESGLEAYGFDTASTGDESVVLVVESRSIEVASKTTRVRIDQ